MPNARRGTEEEFNVMLKLLYDNTQKYSSGVIKFIQHADQVDKIFTSYGWDKKGFYAELNARSGVQTHEKIEPEAPKKKEPAIKKLRIQPRRNG